MSAKRAIAARFSTFDWDTHCNHEHEVIFDDWKWLIRSRVVGTGLWETSDMQTAQQVIRFLSGHQEALVLELIFQRDLGEPYFIGLYRGKQTRFHPTGWRLIGRGDSERGTKQWLLSKNADWLIVEPPLGGVGRYSDSVRHAPYSGPVLEIISLTEAVDWCVWNKIDIPESLRSKSTIPQFGTVQLGEASDIVAPGKESKSMGESVHEDSPENAIISAQRQAGDLTAKFSDVDNSLAQTDNLSDARSSVNFPNALVIHTDSTLGLTDLPPNSSPLTENDRHILVAMLESGARLVYPQSAKTIVGAALFRGDEKRAFRNLRQNGLVKSKTGAGGGYWLTESGKAIANQIKSIGATEAPTDCTN